MTTRPLVRVYGRVMANLLPQPARAEITAIVIDKFLDNFADYPDITVGELRASRIRVKASKGEL